VIAYALPNGVVVAEIDEASPMSALLAEIAVNAGLQRVEDA
jgi:hypothetical protein